MPQSAKPRTEAKSSPSSTRGAGKRAASSQPGKLIRKSEEDIRRYSKSPQAKIDAARIAAIRDEDIDFSDIPLLTDEELAQMRPAKQQLTIRIDSDVLAWLRSKEGPYLTRLNNTLRAVMLKEQARKSAR